ncbi:hypothetical protein A11A3_06141 [Alcanivorax hongdengensis A-11-3]|uniref:DUF2069 domain-containing protein n=1 Tax=Alcanivorax hongdengensis A-11-3 TaxID=1177179 RepID=L0WDD9_9GAMM|nr:DUF2069 domain-containing protein [Alcanivorax hongdengensis]EKF75011.1 hypothetical protein A11A3_06141 [Alcanivorax hongdengensis A-11-3]
MILWLMRLSYLLLLVIGVSGLFILAPPQTPWMATLIMAGLLYMPLLLMAPACGKGDPRLATWLCFLLLIYFCGFSIQLLDPAPVRTLAIAKTSLTVMLFVTAALQIRKERHAD